MHELSPNKTLKKHSLRSSLPVKPQSPQETFLTEPVKTQRTQPTQKLFC